MGIWCLSKVPGFRGRHTVRMLLSRGTQEAISRRCTHGEQLVATLLREMQMPMPVKGFNKGGQERDQPFGIDLIGRFPCQQEACWTAGHSEGDTTAGFVA